MQYYLYKPCYRLVYEKDGEKVTLEVGGPVFPAANPEKAMLISKERLESRLVEVLWVEQISRDRVNSFEATKPIKGKKIGSPGRLQSSCNDPSHKNLRK